MAVVADTHTLIWYLRNSNRLSEAATVALDKAIQDGDLIYIASISLVEIAYLVEKTRISEVAFEQLNQALVDPATNFRVVPLDREIAQTIRQVPRDVVPEMPDRIIAATALHLNHPLVTRDHKIQAFSGITTIW